MIRKLGLAAFFLLTATVSGYQDADPIKAKLEKAKATFEVDLAKAKTAVLDHLAAREAAARKDGNKKLVDSIKAEREAYEDTGELPKSLPITVKQKLSVPRAILDAAYVQAIKDYTKAKKDDEAAAVEIEWNVFKKGGDSAPAVPGANGNELVGLVSRLGRIAVVSERETKDGPMVLTGAATPNGKAHLWKLVPAEEGWFYIATADGERVIGTVGNRTNNGAEIVVGPKKAGEAAKAQQWRMVPADKEKGWAKFEQRSTNKFFGVDNNSTELNMRLLLWEGNSSAAQLWRVEKVKSP